MDKEVYNFPNDISPKVTVTALEEFELAYFETFSNTYLER